MPYCQSCGNKISEADIFCSNCGEKMNQNNSITLSNPSISEMKNSIEYNVVLTSGGKSKLAIIKLLKDLTDVDLKQAQNLFENVPQIIKQNISKKEAESLKAQLEDLEAKVIITKAENRNENDQKRFTTNSNQSNSQNFKPDYCPECGVEIKYRVAACPKCGFPLIASKSDFSNSYGNGTIEKNNIIPKSSSKIIIFLVIFIFIGGMIWFFKDQNDKKQVREWRQYRDEMKSQGKDYLNFQNWKNER